MKLIHTPQTQTNRPRLHRLCDEARASEVAIISFVEGEIRDAVADGLDDLRFIYSQIIELCCEEVAG